jgi:ribosome maturation factor RimP
MEQGSWMKLDSGLEKELTELAEDEGLELLATELVGSGPRTVLRLVIDGPSGVTLDQCADISRRPRRSRRLDPIRHAHTLEVTSWPRPQAVCRQEYTQFAGRKVKVKMIRDTDAPGGRRRADRPRGRQFAPHVGGRRRQPAARPNRRGATRGRSGRGSEGREEPAMKLEINTLVRQVAAERDIEPEKLIEAIAEAISSAARKHFKERNVLTEIEPESGEVDCWIVRDVVEEVEDPETEMTIEQARAVDTAAEIGKLVKLGELDTSQLGRIAAQSARQVLFQRVREAERAVVYRNYVGRIHEMINGIVKRIDRGSIIVELTTPGHHVCNHLVRHSVTARATASGRWWRRHDGCQPPAGRPPRTDPALLEAARDGVPRSTTAPWSSRSASASPVSGRRSRSSPRTATSTRSAPASASRAPASRPSPASSRARRSTSSPGTATS